MALLIQAGETTAARKRVYFQCVDASDGMTPETGEAGGQPQISTDGAAFADAGIGVLVAIGNGRYYAELTDAAVASEAVIESRYKSAETAEAVGTTAQVVGFDPGAVAVGAAVAGDEMDLVDAPNATAVTAIQAGLALAAKLLSYVQSLARKDVTVDTDIGGTYDDATDSQEALREKVDTLGGGGGANTVTITVEDESAAPLQGATVVIRASAGGAVTSQQTTDANGIALLALDDATYCTQATRLTGYTHTEESLVVSGTTAATLTMTAFDPGSPASADVRRVWMRTWNPEAGYEAGRPAFTVELDVLSKYTDGRVAPKKVKSTDHSDDSYAYVDILPTDVLTAVNSGETVLYRVTIHETGEVETFALPTGDLSEIELVSLID